MKTLDEYYERLDANALPVMRGVELNADDLLRRDVIQKLMCNFELDFAAVGARVRHPVRRLLRAGSRGARRRSPPTAWSSSTSRGSRVTPRGRLLVRTVAMQFDRYLREAQAKAQYSKVI